MSGTLRVFIHARPEQPQFGALADGLLAAGLTPVFQRPSGWKRADADPRAAYCIVNGLRGEGGEIAEAYRALHVPVWILELPRLRDELDAWALLHDNLFWLPAPNGRAAYAMPALRRPAGDHLLVIGQKADDASHQMTGPQMAKMLREMVAACRVAHPNVRVVVRPHPLDNQVVPADMYGADAISDSTEMLRDAMRRALAIVTYNSTSGWDAIAAGVPVVTFAKRDRCAYYHYTTSLNALAKLNSRQRQEALQRAASTQWTLDELRSGSAVRRSLLAHTPLMAESA